MAGPSTALSASFTRPANTTAYASGDLVANSTTAGSVVTMSFGRVPTSGLWLRKIELRKSDPDVTSASFRLWLTTDSAVTFTNGDNGALSIASSTLAIGDVIASFDITVDRSLPGSGDIGYATFDPGLHFIGGGTTVYGFLEARAAYTPGSEEVFTVGLRGEPFY